MLVANWFWVWVWVEFLFSGEAERSTSLIIDLPIGGDCVFLGVLGLIEIGFGGELFGFQ